MATATMTSSAAAGASERHDHGHGHRRHDHHHGHHHHLTRVNGIGLWNSWTRNFKTPLLAMLDLLDNSVDAAFVPPPGEPEGTRPGSRGVGGGFGQSQEQEQEDPPPLRPDSASASATAAAASASARAFRGKVRIDPDADPHTSLTTGLKIVNNSANPIKDLGEIMEVYSSSKGRDEHGAELDDQKAEQFAETIGENGVGLKQGCATLSDLSFVLVRNGRRMGLAVVAASLQSPAGIYLPHFDFEATELQMLRNEMMTTFASDRYRGVGDCVGRYGGTGSLADGVDRLLRHFADLTRPGSWGDEDNVFCVVLHHLKHGGTAYDAGTETAPAEADADAEAVPVISLPVDGGASISNGGDGSDAASMDEQYSDRAYGLMRELRDELPRNYIHVAMDVLVCSEPVHFHYWQRRLVELTSFFVYIDPNRLYVDAPDWKQPVRNYPIRIFCGFDSVRLTADRGASACSLYVYSRHSGRLIKYEEDARALLKLPSGGTEYSQGLTVVVDDMLGNLPLNPTKQDVAFGEQAHGDAHKRNLYSWVGAICCVYYKYHLEDKAGGKKGVLTRKVREFGTPVVDPSRLAPLNGAEFTEFRDTQWKLVGGAIRINSRKAMSVVEGRDTVRKLRADPVAPAAAAGGTAARKRKRRRAWEAEATADVVGLPAKRSRARVNYNEGEEEGEAVEVQVDADFLDDVSAVVADAEPADLNAAATPSDGDKGNSRVVTPADAEAARLSLSPEATAGAAGHGDGVKCEEEAAAAAAAAEREIESLRNAVKKHKEKSHERKRMLRQQDGRIKDLKRSLAASEERLRRFEGGGGTGTPTKSAREMRLEEEKDQLMAVLQQQEQERQSKEGGGAAHEEKDRLIQQLMEENKSLRKERRVRMEENASLTLKLEEVTDRLEQMQEREHEHHHKEDGSEDGSDDSFSQGLC